jgi:hypothetical protein
MAALRALCSYVLAVTLAAGAAHAGDGSAAASGSATVESADGRGAPAVAATGEQNSTCLLMEAAARANDLPVEFFVRLIWQESRFDAEATGPVTRNGQRAEGIAQFMPGTAADRNLLDPYDPVQALPKSAEFLRDLRNEFGNLGLAAAAYNAGPRRVREWMEGSGGLPAETRNYVATITGVSAEDWMTASADANVPFGKDTKCSDLVAHMRRTPSRFFAALEQRVAIDAGQRWGVQLSAGFSRDHALNAYSRLAKRYQAVLGNHDPIILANRLRSRGSRAFYQVRAGAPTRAQAEALCTRIRRAGGACLVLRNRGSVS